MKLVEAIEVFEVGEVAEEVEAVEEVVGEVEVVGAVEVVAVAFGRATLQSSPFLTTDGIPNSGLLGRELFPNGGVGGLYRGYKNIYGQKYSEYMGRQITEILEKHIKPKNKKNMGKPRTT